MADRSELQLDALAFMGSSLPQVVSVAAVHELFLAVTGEQVFMRGSHRDLPVR